MRKALIVATIGGFIASFEMNDIKILQDMGYEVHGAADFKAVQTDADKKKLIKSGLICHQISFTRSPFSSQNIKAYAKLVRLMEREHFDLVHCHTPVGGVLGRMAAHKTRVPHVLYTAHGFHFFDGAPKKNWIIYYPVEKFLSRWTDTLITINHEDYRRAKREFHAKKVKYIPGVGVDLDKFSSSLYTEEERKKIRRELGIPENAIWLLSVGELNENKNHETVIRALAEIQNSEKVNLKEDSEHADGGRNEKQEIYYTIAGEGALREDLQSLIAKLGLSEKIKLLGYRDDVSLLCEAADIFVMPSFREGLSVALMEAMASGMPCVVSRIRGNIDLIDKHGGGLFDPHSVEECCTAITKIMNSDFEKMGIYNRNKMKHFDKKVVLEGMRNIYEGGGTPDI